MNIIPFGEVIEERFEEAKQYKLVEMIAGFWRLTKKCNSHYEPLSYINYLQGKTEKQDVQKTGAVKQNKEQKPKKHFEEKPQYISKNDLITDILGM